MNTRSLKLSFIALLCITLAGCLSFGPLKYRQVKLLKKEGFVLTDEGWTLGLPERLLFDFNNAQLKQSHEAELVRLANQLNKYDLNKLKIVGHTDDVGEATYNQKLSEERAQSVANLFLTRGFKKENIYVIGRGSTQPYVPNTTNENRAINRRVAIVVIP
ncbi:MULTISPECIES: OmpA family protein [Acinetobacter]|jgi:outer membrane protein OmpA-like peptidoglycan-associated protein|uniref:OmpA family protein n=1 Tax=Acinetobacter pittii TaxID=48296 RepID=A0A6H2VFE3_ACIPI|nr:MULTISPECIES: OmpA family protein [Acinetobacter calcoaceticus/baumannii complex]AZP28093.1 OmpA family protein [Acinetobacter pittii]EXE24520.1 ompA family protein [Acinetobacter sp. 907131]MBF9205372.1 OmpA family protein [Acinetobacter pittii]MBK0412143.1 OmpA family protein [Acinetobacter pittii]MBK1418216.1 OmpA family protein [Acinetobacter pittii]